MAALLGQQVPQHDVEAAPAILASGGFYHYLPDPLEIGRTLLHEHDIPTAGSLP
jgi:hypothetical protein